MPEAKVITGQWWRHVPHDGEPLYKPEHPSDNRWQLGDIIEGWYFASSKSTAWAEWYRYLAEHAIPPQESLPRDMFQWKINNLKVADLSTETRLKQMGLPMPAPNSQQWPKFQAVGHALYKQGWRGVISPSAAQPAKGKVLCIFRESHEIDIPEIEVLGERYVQEYPPLVPKHLRT
jgi:RES domain-containing protein